jgi:hypothetical protein
MMFTSIGEPKTGCASRFWSIATTGAAEGFAQISHDVAKFERVSNPRSPQGAEDTEAAQRPDSRTLRTLCGLGASALKSRLQNYNSPKIVTHTLKN